MMRLGISSYTYTWAIGVPGYPQPERPMTLDDLCRQARSMGVSTVQVADNLPLDRLSDDALAALRARLDRDAMTLEVGANGMTPERLSRYIDIAHRLRSPLLRYVVDGPEYRPSCAEAIDVIREALPLLRRKGVLLAIENHDRFGCADFIAMVEQTDPRWVGICLDTVNSFGALEGPEEVIRQLLPLTVNLHIKDFTIERVPSKMGFTIAGAPAGAGRLDVPDLYRRLTRIGRCHSAILELWTPYRGAIAPTVALEADWAAQSVRYLQGIFAPPPLPIPEKNNNE